MRAAAFIATLLLLAGCTDEFNPVAEGERPYVVFALFNTSQSTQIIRVHETYPPATANPGSPSIPGTSVTITGSSGTVVLRDTILVPPAGSGSSDSIGAFVLDPFVPVRGATYVMTVSSPRGPASAAVTIPGDAEITTTDFIVLRSPYAYSTERTISVRTLLSTQTLGYVVRLLIEYERLINGVWTTEVVEVPTVYRDLVDENTYTAEYPALTRRATAIVTSSRGIRETETNIFRNSAYLQTLSILYRKHGPSNLRMKRVLFVMTQADTHFFTYYSYANFFQDKFTIRVDQPDYSNVIGALGFFGSMTTDTIAYALPVSLAPPVQ